MSALEPFLAAVAFTELGDGRFRAGHITSGHGTVVFGGQLLAQTIEAASRTVPDKRVKSVHTVFARGGSTDAPLDIDVEVLHGGRAFASLTVTTRQGERTCTRALVLLEGDEPDLIRHGPPMPDVPGPASVDGRTAAEPWWEIAVVGGIDISDPDAVGPAELAVWTRFPDAPSDPRIGQELLAYATDGFLIGTAMRPHPGVGQALAHVSISTTVLTHTLTFHEPVDASRWMLLAQESPYAGRGRSYGRAHVFTEDGALVASFVQENMIRDMPQERRPPAGDRARY